MSSDDELKLALEISEKTYEGDDVRRFKLFAVAEQIEISFSPQPFDADKTPKAASNSK